MNIDEMKKERMSFNSMISKKIKDFETKTGLSVYNIKIDRESEDSGSNTKITSIVFLPM